MYGIIYLHLGSQRTGPGGSGKIRLGSQRFRCGDYPFGPWDRTDRHPVRFSRRRIGRFRGTVRGLAMDFSAAHVPSGAHRPDCVCGGSTDGWAYLAHAGISPLDSPRAAHRYLRSLGACPLDLLSVAQTISCELGSLDRAGVDLFCRNPVSGTLEAVVGRIGCSGLDCHCRFRRPRLPHASSKGSTTLSWLSSFFSNRERKALLACSDFGGYSEGWHG